MIYRPITLPKLNWEQTKSVGTFGELVIQPLEPGFGMTLGNALRRAALAAVEGSSVTSVIIKGANNEFATLNGVMEDVINVVLNIKGIVIKNSTGEPGKMTLSFKGEGIAKVANIKADSHLELLNPEHVIAHVASDGELEIEFFVESGRGYQSAQWPLGESLQKDNRIFIDAMFSPVRRIEFKVEKTRVGQSFEHDKLILGVQTNGTLTPQDVVHYATSVLRTQLEHFLAASEIPFNEISVESKAEVPAVQSEAAPATSKGVRVDLLLKPIEELEFSVRAHNCLVSSGVKRVIDLVNMTEDEVLKIKNFGRKSLREVKEILKAFGLGLGMNIKELDLKKMIKEQEGQKL